jgi:hypothetical protein
MMMKTKNLLIFSLLVLIAVSPVQALIIESTTANQNTYKNGDLITLTVETNAAGLEVTADFSAVDSSFNAGMVIIEPEGTTYYVSYPITFKNTKGDNTYNSLITMFDPVTSTTNSVTYGIHLENIGQREDDSKLITLKVQEEPEISIKDGFIQICRDDECETISEKEYEASRRIIISEGKVELSGLTYNQLKSEIEASVHEQLRQELQNYVLEITEIKKLLDNNLHNMQNLVIEQKNFTEQSKIETEAILRRGNRNNLIVIGAVILMILAFAYTIYLRTETTWFNRS